MGGGSGRRRREVAVGGALAGDEAADEREDVVEVEVVERAAEAVGLVALEDAELAAGAEDAVDSARPAA